MHSIIKYDSIQLEKALVTQRPFEKFEHMQPFHDK